VSRLRFEPRPSAPESSTLTTRLPSHPVGSRPTPNTWFAGPMRVHNPNGFSWAVYEGLTVMLHGHTQTDTLHLWKEAASLHSTHAMQPNNDNNNLKVKPRVNWLTGCLGRRRRTRTRGRGWCPPGWWQTTEVSRCGAGQTPQLSGSWQCASVCATDRCGCRTCPVRHGTATDTRSPSASLSLCVKLPDIFPDFPQHF